MNNSNKIGECIRLYIREFFAAIHKKASFPWALTKKLCHVVVRLNQCSHIALRLVSRGRNFFANNVMVK